MNGQSFGGLWNLYEIVLMRGTFWRQKIISCQILFCINGQKLFLCYNFADVEKGRKSGSHLRRSFSPWPPLSLILLAPTKPFEHHHHHAEDDVYKDDDDDDDQEENEDDHEEDDDDHDDRMSSRVKLCSKIYWLCDVGSWLCFPEHIPDQILDGEQ